VQSALYARARAVHKVVKVQEFTGAARRVDGVTFRLKTARLVKQLDVGVYLARFIELALYITRPFPLIVLGPRIADAISVFAARDRLSRDLRAMPFSGLEETARGFPLLVRFSIFHFPVAFSLRTVR